jgi:hypothetical protein
VHGRRYGRPPGSHEAKTIFPTSNPDIESG